MSLAIVYSRAQVGVGAPAVLVEAHLANGLPALTLVGLPEASVKESKDRVRSAIVNSGLTFPPRRITLNLAPADLPKDGGRFDLAIAGYPGWQWEDAGGGFSGGLKGAAIYSVANQVPMKSWPQRPFRHPQHSASGEALVGGDCRILIKGSALSFCSRRMKKPKHI